MAAPLLFRHVPGTKRFIGTCYRWGANHGPTGCAVKALVHSGGIPRPGTSFRSTRQQSEEQSREGNETAEASGAEGREGDLASMQAVT